MKIASKISVAALSTALCLVLWQGGQVFAQEVVSAPAPTTAPAPGSAVASAPAPAPAPAAVPGPTSDVATAPAPGPSSDQVSSSLKYALESISVPGTSASVAKAMPSAPKAADANEEAESDDAELGLPESSVKIPKSVKKVVKSLSDTTENITLENLNAAREAVVKLDVLIDIEKRLNDLAKLRQEREGGGGIDNTMAAPPSIDPSVLMPPSAGMPSIPDQQVMPQTQMANLGNISSSSLYEVVRIVGASGNYAAQIKDAGNLQLVHVGDTLSDGSRVKSISKSGVSLQRSDKSRETLSMKDAPVFFHTR
ncbi:MAG: hypothetical protein AB7E52_01660 [Bdellovibrionales bacterium]